MDRDEFHIFLPSDSSKEYYKNNTLSQYTTHLAQVLDFTKESWEVGLAEIGYNSFKNENESSLFIYVDIIQPQIVGDNYSRILRILPFPYYKGGHKIFDPIFYFPIDKGYFQDIEIRLISKDGTNIDFYESNIATLITLHFRRSIKK